MADAKITDLAELSVAAMVDILPIVDIGAPSVTKKITVANLFSEFIRTEIVTYVDLLALDADGFLLQRTWQDETVSVFIIPGGSAPRSCTVSTIPGVGIMTGTATINGTDVDGAVIQEVLTINDAVPTTHETDRAFSTVTNIVIDKTDVSFNPQYKFGWGNRIGLPNYPLGATSDVKKVVLGGTVLIVTTDYTVNITYGTIIIDPLIVITVGVGFIVYLRNSAL